MTSLARTAGAVALIAASAAALTGCGGIGAQLTFNDTEKVKVSEIVVDGGSGDVRVTTAAIQETRIKRLVNRGSEPDQSYSLAGTVLTVNTDCGRNCTVSYEIEAPAGVTVRGKLGSGTIGLDGTGAVDVAVSSGDVQVRNVTGPVTARATSGNLEIIGVTGATDLVATSGDIRASGVRGKVVAKASSGDIQVQLAAPASVSAVASSGDVDVIVPQGSYRVQAEANDSDDAEVTGITSDPSAANVLDLRASSGSVRVSQAA